MAKSKKLTKINEKLKKVHDNMLKLQQEYDSGVLQELYNITANKKVSVELALNVLRNIDFAQYDEDLDTSDDEISDITEETTDETTENTAEKKESNDKEADDENEEESIFKSH